MSTSSGLALGLAAALCMSSWLAPAHAQTGTQANAPYPVLQPNRHFNDKVQRGQVVILSTTEAKLNGKVERLAPGARVRDDRNMLVFPSNLIGQELTVNYVRDPSGLLHDMWILTSLEARQPTPAERHRMISGQRPQLEQIQLKQKNKANPESQLPWSKGDNI